MKIVNKIFVVAILLVSVFSSAKAITPEEMEQAKTITALWYLRYANNGSDYLEKISPKTMSDLETKLKKKEKENIKSFKAVEIPSDYAEWDKDKMVDYWSNTFFKSAGLNSEGLKAKSRVRKKLNNMQISSVTTETQKEGPANANEPKSEITADSPQNEMSVVSDSLSMSNTLQTSAIEEEFDLRQTENPGNSKSQNSSTSTYVVILIVLVIIVVILIVYAMRMMKQKQEPEQESENKEIQNDMVATCENNLVSQKNMEIVALQEEIEVLKMQLQLSQNKVAELRNELKNSIKKDAMENTLTGNTNRRQMSPRTERVIYLARANNQGIFVRAESEYNSDNSIFRLKTSDGVSGSFSIIDNPQTVSRVLSSSKFYLANACVADDDFSTAGITTIVNHNVGTAIFENGRWIVTRKAKIEFR